MVDLFAHIQQPTANNPNQLYYGDNLDIMREMKTASVDLIYLDPPFNSQRNYNLLYSQRTGLPVPEQEEAFCDAWELDEDKEDLIRQVKDLPKLYNEDADIVLFWNTWINALRNTQPKLLAYLLYMTFRLYEMRRILKPTGSIFLHCDPTASHYIKVIMDSIFGHRNFRNEIYWHYYNKMHDSRKKLFPRATDTLLFYVKEHNADFTFHQLKEKRNEPVKQLKRVKKDGKIVNARDADGKLMYQIKDDKTIDNVWRLPALQPASPERLGYPTQKPTSLLKRVILASTNPGDTVFDPFCGCGTTIYAAHETGRRWIGCDIAILSVALVREVLLKRYGLKENVNYETSGIPLSVDGAIELFNKSPRQFQNWAVELAGGFCNKKHSGDRGVDGRIWYDTRDGLKSMVISVKGGTSLGPAQIRELVGTHKNEAAAELAGFICLYPPTKGMEGAAKQAGNYDYLGVSYPRCQIRTIEDLLQGKGFITPSRVQTMDWKRQSELAVWQ